MARFFRCVVAACCVAGLPLTAAAGPIGYAQATGYFKKDSRPTLYQPLNLLDGRDNTAWCSPTADPLNEVLSFGFDGPTRIDEIRISTGNNFDEATFKAFARAKKLVFTSGKQSQTIELNDERGGQGVTLRMPFTGERFTLEVADQYPSDDPDQPVCITDVIFVLDGKALNGSWLLPKLKYDKQTAPLLGTWYAGFAGTPDHFLSFFIDGTFRYTFEPIDAIRGQPITLSGSYEASPSRIVFTLPEKGRVSVKANRDKALKSSKPGFELTLEGDLPAEMKQRYRSAP
ncbi:MAG: discoidin domain-containing protein [Myxococcaceae bacterium]|nr:discoidin domain-containing protein [Myxococcaceae bacterium]